VCESYSIEEYPTILYLEEGRSIISYQGDFTKKSFEDFARKHASKKR
jgi:hypothetical protein